MTQSAATAKADRARPRGEPTSTVTVRALDDLARLPDDRWSGISHAAFLADPRKIARLFQAHFTPEPEALGFAGHAAR